MAKAKQKEVTEDTIVVMACRFSIDWTYDNKHEIELSKICGIELDWRGDDWHVIVVTREKTSDDKNRTYELDHWVPIAEIRKLINNPKVKIRKIGNMHSSKNFIEELKKITQPKNKTTNE